MRLFRSTRRVTGRQSGSRMAKGSSASRRLFLEPLEHRIVLATGSGGGLDTAFDSDGRVTTSFGTSSDVADAVAIQADGKIVTVGSSDSSSANSDFAIARYHADGSLDTSFDGDGKVTVNFGGDDEAFDVAIQPDGKIVVVGKVQTPTSSKAKVGIARFNSDGTLDTTFDTDGLVAVDIQTIGEEARGVAIQTDGKIVVAGQTFSSFSTSGLDYFVARFNSNGSFDTSFDSDGKVIIDFAGDRDQGSDVAIQSDGKIVVAGRADVQPLGPFDFGVARLNSNGSLDTSFDTDGLVTTSFGATVGSQANAVAIQADGQIVAGGQSGAGSTSNFVLARYNALDGSLDTSFDGDGRAVTSFSSFDAATDLAIQGDGKIVAAGLASQDFALARYDTNGSLDTDFDTDGRVTTDFGDLDQGRGVAIQADGKIVAAGLARVGSVLDFALARYEGGGAPPVADAGGPYNVLEGGTVVLSGSATDDVPATLVFEWDLDGDNIFGETGAAATRGDEIGQNPTYSAGGLDGPSAEIVQLRVTDECNLSHTDSATINVSNAAPTVVLDPVAMINENESATLTGMYTDPGLPDSHDLVVDWDDPNDSNDSTFAVPAITTLSASDTFNSTMASRPATARRTIPAPSASR